MSDGISNKATASWEAAARRLRARDYDAIDRWIAADVVRVDRRAVGAPTTRRREDVLTAARELVEGIGFDSWNTWTVEVRGDCLALTGVEWVNEAGYEISWIQVVRTNQDGLITLLVYFDRDDSINALSELEALWTEQQAEH